MEVQTIDPLVFREVMGHYPTGVVVVTGVHPDGEDLALIIGTFNSVSLDPPMVSFLPMKNSRTFERLRECDSMCINVLTGDQESTGRTIATRRSDKFAGLEIHRSPSGDPILAGSLAWIDVRLNQVVDAGDHWIALCDVLDLAVENPTGPLIFFQGGYGRFIVPSLIARVEEDITGAVRQAETVRSELEAISAELGCEATLLTQVNHEELAAVATAIAPGLDSGSYLGRRIPLVAPLGDMFIAQAAPEVHEQWISRAIKPTEEDVIGFRERLELVRRLGYSVSLRSSAEDHSYSDLTDAIVRYSSGRLTPAEEKQMRQVIARSVCYFPAEELQPGQAYDVGSIAIPVARGLILLASQLPAGVDQAQVLGWVGELRNAADRIEARLEASQVS